MYRSFFRKLFIELFICIAIELSYEVDLVYFIESLIKLRLFFVFEESMDGNGAGFSRQMLSLIVCNSLVVVVETNILRSQELKTSHLVVIFLGKPDEIGPVFFLRVCVVNDHAVSFFDLFLSNFVALLFCLQSVPVYSRVFR